MVFFCNQGAAYEIPKRDWRSDVCSSDLGEERVIVVLRGVWVVGPRAAAEAGQPVVRRGAVRRRVAPKVPIALRIVPGAARGLEPRVLVRAVVRDEVEDQLEAARMRSAHQAVEILQRAEEGVNGGVVRDVVAEILHRRGIDRR